MRRILLTAVLVVCTLTLSARCRAEYSGSREAFRSYMQDVWEVQEGVSSISINSIAQTPDGYLWLGTETGLVRFNGTQFVTFNHSNTPALKEDYIQSILAEPDGTLWVASKQGSLVKMTDRQTFTRLVSGGANDAGRIQVLAIDRLHHVLAGTHSGLKMLAGNTLVDYPLHSLKRGEGVRSLTISANGDLWIGTDSSGLVRVTAAGEQNYTSPQLSSNRIFSLFEDRDRNLWIGTDRGLDELQHNQWIHFGSSSGLADRHVRSIAQMQDGHIFVGTGGGGLNRLDNGKFTPYTTVDGLPADIVPALFEDREGSLWVGTDGGGLSRLEPRSVLTFAGKEGLSRNRTTSVLQTRDGTMWVGTEGGGLNHLVNGRFSAFTTREGMSSNLIRALLEDRDGNLWVGTDGAGLNLIRAGKVVRFRSGPAFADAETLALAQERNGTVWIGTSKGLGYFRNGVFSRFKSGTAVSDDVITALLVDRAGNLWIATIEHGLQRLSNGTLSSFEAAGLPREFVNSIYEAPDGTLWMGTNGGGLVRYRAGAFFTFTPKQGMLDMIGQVLQDNHGNLWLSSSRGLARVSLRALADVQHGSLHVLPLLLYGKSDGMRSQECATRNQPNGWKDAKGDLWFPTAEGVAVVNPNRLPATSVQPRAIVESLIADNQTFNPHGPLHLGRNVERIELHYAAPSFLAPAKVSYRYQLVGFDRGWIYAKSRSVAYYARLAPGVYRFRVASRFDGGPWQEAALTTTFELEPHFYQRLSFQVLCAMGILLALAFAYRQRVRIIRTNELRFAREVAKKTGELAQLKKQFQNLFSDTPTPLFLYDTDTLAYLEVNQAAVSKYGYSREEFLAMRITDLRSPEESARLIRLLKVALNDEGNLGTWQHRLKNGALIDVEITTRDLEWNGRPARLVAAQDVTMQRQVEAALQRAKDNAEASSRAKSDFLANMSHEIRTPMNGVLGMAHLLLHTELDRVQTEYAQNLTISAESLLAVINDILDLSKIEASKLELQEASFNLRDSCTAALKPLGFRADEKQLEFVLNVAPEVPDHLIGDSGRLRQILVNLVGNALKFTEHGHVCVSVALQEEEANQVLLHFRIDDTGIGVPPAKLAVIFEPFAQADGSVTRRYGGTGLGLAISRRLAEMMGGALWVDSQIDTGSTFHFTVRMARAGIACLESVVLLEVEGANVVLLDRDGLTSRSLIEPFECWGMRVLLTSGADFLAALAHPVDEATPDAVLIASRYETDSVVRNAIAHHPKLAGVPKFWLAPSAPDEDLVRLANLPYSRLFCHPVGASEVARALRDHLIAKGSARDEPKLLAPGKREDGDTDPKLRILVAEDNRVNQLVVRRLLEQRGHRVFIANHGREALAVLDRETVDVFLCDVQMPELDGFGTTAEVRRREAGTSTHLPIIALTAHAMRGDDERCYAAGMDGYLSKPVDAEKLFHAVRSLTRQYPAKVPGPA